MELTKDVMLRGETWDKAITNFAPFFQPRAQYDIFMLCISIGIMYDQRLEKSDDNTYEHSIARNVFNNHDNGKLDFMFQAAILSTHTIDTPEAERLELAFGDKTNFNKIGFLSEFANFGVTVLVKQIGESRIETMDNLKSFLTETVEGRNFDIDPIPDEILLDE